VFWKNGLLILAAVALGSTAASASSFVFTCDASIDLTAAGTCAYLNSTVAGYYTSTFSNVNVNIYIRMGITGLGSSTSGFLNLINYSAYRSDLITTASNDAVDTAAKASLPGAEPALFNSGQVEVTSALGAALGISNANLLGTTTSNTSCHPGAAGCYNGIITITTPANLSSETGGQQSLYWDQLGGSQPALSYDFYSIVQHEADEILGTSSCVSTSSSLTEGCGGNNVGAVDLFRYNAGTRVFIDSTTGAYFSFNGGVSNGANGAVYNTSANGQDYADFASNCAFVQDATGCLGQKLNITTDGNAEINILNAIGYNLTPTPEPGTWLTVLAGMSALAIRRLRARR
jgi:hypothetical protein